MGIYVELIKSNTNEADFVQYIYQVSIPVGLYINKAGKKRCTLKMVAGMIKINKQNGEVFIVKLADGDDGMYVQRAAAALRRHWHKGEYPSKTCWAS